MYLTNLIKYSRLETKENHRKMLMNINQSDVSKLESYDNKAFLDLVNYMIGLIDNMEDKDE